MGFFSGALRWLLGRWGSVPTTAGVPGAEVCLTGTDGSVTALAGTDGSVTTFNPDLTC